MSARGLLPAPTHTYRGKPAWLKTVALDWFKALHDHAVVVPANDLAAPRPTRGLAEELSASELRVLRDLPTNLTRPEIAAELSVSLNTVSTHIRRIYAKLGAADRSSAVQRGRELRLLSAAASERHAITVSR